MDWLAAYDYPLPEGRIARQPAQPRDASRLLLLDRATGARTQTVFRQLPRFLRPGDLLVLNETRVLRARLRARLARTGRAVEILLSHREGDAWLAMVGPSRRLRPGDRLVLEEPAHDPLPGGADGAPRDRVSLPLGAAGPPEGSALVLSDRVSAGLWRLRGEDLSVEACMERSGHVPLPPYLRREDVARDREWYQTVFARAPGAVAAPTAGLHFTHELLARCEAAGIGIAKIVLHVGPGTFLPVRAASEEAHRVLPERFEIPEETEESLARTRATGGRIVAVGTTTVRALETAARGEGNAPAVASDEREVPRAAAAGDAEDVPRAAAAGDAEDVRRAAASGDAEDVPRAAAAGLRSGWTSLTIVPGHRFLAVDALITNFHLPMSSLLLLVAAFAGREPVLAAYAEARDAGFRFYSYGDAMLIV